LPLMVCNFATSNVKGERSLYKGYESDADIKQKRSEEVMDIKPVESN